MTFSDFDPRYFPFFLQCILPELKVQVSFSDLFMSAVSHSVFLGVQPFVIVLRSRHLFQVTEQISTKLAESTTVGVNWVNILKGGGCNILTEECVEKFL